MQVDKDSVCNDVKRNKLDPLFLLRSLLSLHLFFESCLYLQALELCFLFEMENHLNSNAFSPEHAQADLQQITAVLLDIRTELRQLITRFYTAEARAPTNDDRLAANNDQESGWASAECKLVSHAEIWEQVRDKATTGRKNAADNRW